MTTIKYIQDEMAIHDKEREYINPFERQELIDIYLIQSIKEAKDILSPIELGNHVKKLLEAELNF